MSTRRLTNATVAAIIAGGLAAAQPAFAADPKGGTVPEVQPSTSSTDAAGPRYCFESKLTGSILTRRVCHTRAEWLKTGVDPVKAAN